MDRGKSPILAPRHDSSSRIGKPESAADKLAALKARVAAAVGSSKAKIGTGLNVAPHPVLARGGLNVDLHPALQDLGQYKPSKTVAPKFATSIGNARPQPEKAATKSKKRLDLSGPSAEETRNNPYFDMSLGGQTATLKNRHSRQLVFNQKGKYIQQANALRRQAALEAMKKRIAESSRKIGIDEDLDTEKNYIVEAPPDIEWWDEGLLDAKSYDSIDDPTKVKIDTPDSIITEYIQHPVLLEPPQEKNMPAPKPMFLTSKEQAKLRRQRRMAELKEQQAKIRLGLEPAPPPKVKKGNLMRVLGEEAVKDPTAVEARVNREIAARHQAHVKMNEDRKLTKEQRHEKLATNQDKDAAKGIRVMVFKIDNLANGSHRFKISKNAEQMALTGICIMHPRFNLVIVEGGEHSIRRYRKLMLQRIDWTENSPTRIKEGKNAEALQDWLKAEDEKGELKDMTLNKCVLVFEGEEKSRAFRKWGSKVCETDSAARDALTRAKMENFWTVAKSMK
ncbi:pre-mRNA processing factor 3-domain-containing protein [Amylocarpus encephaloides]|uniref:Pre-mRNA processing factor 3-domain-containing protein n=1 Tax=Amylocarpus encephaloides TaxID=45428 RepID=A0A9P7YED8_9HELO|nr:pre-mRNA processing factor 3-domain-containing protein [Amylocarpus encephaloides]